MTPTAWAHVFIDVPSDVLDPAERFWSAVTGWPSVRPWPGHPEFVRLEPADAGSYVHVQRIDGSPRVHLDLTAADIDTEAARLAELGATRLRRHQWWQVMSSPGGLPFCLCREPARGRPGPVSWPGGHRSRIVQICVDVPNARYESELAFWTAATGWRHEPPRRPEYDWLVPPDSSPLRLLIQRLGVDDPRVSTQAHVDIGTDDVEAEVARVESLGARIRQRMDCWVVLEDPAGLPFCVTPQPPD